MVGEDYESVELLLEEDDNESFELLLEEEKEYESFEFASMALPPATL